MSRHNAHEFAELEEQILAAKDYVVASDSLRAKTLAAAKENSAAEKIANRTVLGGLAFAAVWCVVIPVTGYLVGKQQAISGPTSDQIYQSAEDYAQRYQYENEWGVVDAFTEAHRPRPEPKGSSPLTTANQSPSSSFEPSFLGGLK